MRNHLEHQDRWLGFKPENITTPQAFFDNTRHAQTQKAIRHNRGLIRIEIDAHIDTKEAIPTIGLDDR
jgi:hypothetical protein